MENAIALVMTLLVLGVVGIPLLRDRKPEDDLVADDEYEDPELDRLLSRKETALEAIRELEFDHAVGSLSDEDYEDLKEKYERKAISVLKNLREIGEVSTHSYDRTYSRRAVRAAPTRRTERQRGQELACDECGAPYGQEDRFCAACGAELSVYEGGLTCPECGETYEEGAVFCASCGAELGVVEEGLAADGENIAERFANERVEEAVPPENLSGSTRRKRQTRRVSKPKRTAGNDAKEAG